MSYVDVLIPGIVGVLLVAAPAGFTKPTGDAAADARQRKRIRVIGVVLLGVAALYLLIKLVSRG